MVNKRTYIETFPTPLTDSGTIVLMEEYRERGRRGGGGGHKVGEREERERGGFS